MMIRRFFQGLEGMKIQIAHVVVIGFFLGLIFLGIETWVFKSTLIFEETLFASFIPSVLITILIFRLKKFTKSEIVLCGLLVGTLIFIFGTTFLMNIDRSRSFYVLIWTKETSTITQIQNKSHRIFGEMDAFGIDQRLREQRTRNLIAMHDNKYSLTKEGKAILTFSEILARIFNLSNFQRVEENQ